MIHLPLKNVNTPPGRLLLPGALQQIERAINQLDGEVYNRTYYPHSDITDLLRAYSIHKYVLAPGDKPKCNYCESQIEKAVTLQVEHYRPKAKIEAGENDHVELPGYYWLGLEWSNLLLACPKCNGRNAKGNKFPIRGVRCTPINPLRNAVGALSLVRTNCFSHNGRLWAERPLLLNPEIDYPERFLTFNLQGVMRSHGRQAVRGTVTLATCRLNRDPLVVDRVEVWNAFSRRINVDIAGHITGELDDVGLLFNFKVTCRQIIKRTSPEQEFTLWGRFINGRIDDFIQHYIAANYQVRFKNAYDDVVANG